MICLTCGEALSGVPPLLCPSCGITHEMRPPVVGINHFSQVLAALDAWAEEECTQEDFEAVFFQFVEQFEELDGKWGFRKRPLAQRLSPNLGPRFAAQLEIFDQALEQGFLGIERVEALLAGEDDDFEAAESHLLGLFQGICSASATLLDDLEKLGAL